MWKIPFFTIMLATIFLGGCNWGNNANEETPMEDVGNDIRRGVDDVEDAVNPNRNDNTYDRDVNRSDNVNGVTPDATNPNSNADVNSTNGYDNLPNTNGTNGVEGNGVNGFVKEEKVIEDNVRTP